MEYVLPSVRWFEAGNIFTGSIREDENEFACFQYRGKKEKAEDGGVLLRIWCWFGESCFAGTPEEKIVVREFDLTEEGREQAIQWILEMQRRLF